MEAVKIKPDKPISSEEMEEKLESTPIRMTAKVKK